MVGPDTPQCPPESHKTGSVPFASAETDRQTMRHMEEL